MELLLMNQGRYLSSEHLFDKVWGQEADTEIGIVWVYISYLRKRLVEVEANVVIRAKRNVGYTLEVVE